MAEGRIDFELPLSRRRGTGPVITIWLQRHAQSFFFSLGQLTRNPGASLLTVLVIAVALALPCGLYSVLQNAEQVASRWESSAQLSVFLTPGTSLKQAEERARKIQQWSEIESTHLITPAEALAEFEARAGMSGVEILLDGDNPLPPVISAQMATNISSDQVAEVAKRVDQWEGVDVVELDQAWLQRLQAIIGLIQRGVSILGALLFVGVILIVGNTIRAGIDMRREEIEISLLFGATNAFIRRPFLYAGLVMGLAGAILALLIVAAGLCLLAGPVREVSTLYASTYSLKVPSAGEGLMVLLIGSALGGGGAMVAVGRHLRPVSAT